MLSLRAIDNLVLLKRKIVSYDERNLRAENGKELAGREGWSDSDDTKRISEKESECRRGKKIPDKYMWETVDFQIMEMRERILQKIIPVLSSVYINVETNKIREGEKIEYISLFKLEQNNSSVDKKLIKKIY